MGKHEIEPGSVAFGQRPQQTQAERAESRQVIEQLGQAQGNVTEQWSVTALAVRFDTPDRTPRLTAEVRLRNLDRQVSIETINMTDIECGLEPEYIGSNYEGEETPVYMSMIAGISRAGNRLVERLQNERETR